MKMRPTRFGLFFLAILGAFLLGSINYNNNLGFLLTFLLGSMAFISLFHAYRNLLDLTLVRGGVKPVFAGERAYFEIEVRDETRAHSALDFSFNRQDWYRYDLNRGNHSLVRVGLVMEQRGQHSPGTLMVESSFPLTLFRVRAAVSTGITCLVYPRPVAGPFDYAHSQNEDRSEGMFEGPGVDDFAGLRPYQPGDPPQRLSWKTYSRGQGLFVKEFTGMYGGRIMFEWDRLAESNPEQRLSRLCGLVIEAERRQLTYGLSLPGTVIEPDSGERHKLLCLKTLALHPDPSHQTTPQHSPDGQLRK